ncbi:MAG TPA: hypothetical protein VHW67_01480 [Solirubrobacteraceae bacterium]|nr:hypothetical protein [Solirubrobacteraceae bacterium]
MLLLINVVALAAGSNAESSAGDELLWHWAYSSLSRRLDSP